MCQAESVSPLLAFSFYLHNKFIKKKINIVAILQMAAEVQRSSRLSRTIMLDCLKARPETKTSPTPNT